MTVPERDVGLKRFRSFDKLPNIISRLCTAIRVAFVTFLAKSFRGLRKLLPPSTLVLRIAGGVVAAILAGGILIPLFDRLGVLPPIVDSLERLPPFRWFAEQVQDRFVYPMPPHTYNILVADLAGDTWGGTHTDRIVDALSDQLGARSGDSSVKIQRSFRTLRLPPRRDVAAAHAEAENEGRRQLAKHNGHLLVWGKVVRAENKTALWLNLLPSEGVGTQQSHSFEGSGVHKLPANFGQDFGELLASLVVANSSPVQNPDRYVADVIKPAMEKLAQQVARPSPQWSDDERIQFKEAYALLSFRWGEQKNDTDALKRAFELWGETAHYWSRTGDRLKWAANQHLRGNVLFILGQQQSNRTVLLKMINEAADAYKAAIEARPRTDVPHLWAHSQSNLGNAFHVLGEALDEHNEREKGLDFLTKAVGAYEAALEVFTQKLHAPQWAMTLSNLSDTRVLLGKWKSNLDLLKQAVEAYKEILKVRTRKDAPRVWGVIQHNLGDALSIWGKLTRNTALLNDALNAYESALGVIPKNAPFDWALTEHHRGTALANLGDLENNLENKKGKLTEARTAIQSALNVFRNVGASRQEDTAKKDLGEVEASIK